MITIINYDMGNLGSIQNMVKKIGFEAKVTSSYKEVEQASKIILPGVGAFDHAIKSLRKLNLIDTLKEMAITKKTPTLGICLGMQLLTQGSEEGELPGLGLIKAGVSKFDFSNAEKKQPIPHMGWNKVYQQKDSYMLRNMPHDEMRFYFVHSYAVHCQNESDILTTTNYGNAFVSSFEHDNIVGCQFHPEKSHKFGMTLFKNFMETE